MVEDKRPVRLKTDGRPLMEADIRRGMRFNIIAGALGNVWGSVVGGMPLTMFMNSIGASGVMIGLTVTVQQLAMVLQIPSSFIAERLPTRKSYWGAINLVHRLLWFVPAVLPLFMRTESSRMAHAMVWIVALSGVLAQMATAPWWSWMADLIPERARASFWGTRQSYVSAVNLLAVWLAGYALDALPDPRHGGGSYLGFMLVFGFAAVAGVADILFHFGVPEPKPSPPPATHHFMRRIMEPLRNRDFLWLTLAIGVWNLGLGMVGQFSLICLNRYYHLGYTALSATIISGVIGVFLAGFLWSYVMDRIGARNFGASMMLLAPLLGVVWFFMRDGEVSIALPFFGAVAVSQPLLLLVAVNVFSGMFYSGVGLAQISLAAALAPVAGRTMAMAVHWSVIGLIAALGPVIGGQVMDWLDGHPVNLVLPTGTRFNFYHVLVVLQVLIAWFVALLMMLKVKKRAGEMAFGAALSSLQLGNPLRVLSGIYNIYSMLVRTSVGGRAEAVRKVGEERMQIAVRDLIAQLDDPSAEVREEAAMALGRIGSPDAIEALVRKLEDPNADLGPQIARALRYAHSPGSVDALIKKLSDSDRETVTETARTLGEIGDERAREPLMEVLQGSHDAKVVSASSEALARMGEMAAIYEILPRMQATTNPVLKRSLAVAVGDLLGEQGEFYRVLVREQRSRGSEVEGLLATLSRAIEHATEQRMGAQGKSLKEKARQIRDAYDQRNVERVADLLYDLAIGLAALHYGIEFGGDTQAFLETVIWHDYRFGIGLWYLELLREGRRASPPALRDETDVLLGIYFLSKWSHEHERGGAAE